jgi:rod shape determining protein RodA
MPRKINTFDFAIIIIPLLFVAVSVAVIYGLLVGTNDEGLWMKQFMIALIGLGAFAFMSFFDYRMMRGTSWILYLLGIIMLVAVEFFGRTVNGAMNWLDLKLFRLQPSEVMKVFVIISLAAFFHGRVGKIRWTDLFFSFLLVGIPLFLIFREPDFGTAMVVVFIYFVMLMAARPPIKIVASLLILGGIFVSTIVLAYANVKPFGELIRPYQRERIAVFLNPDRDPYGQGYNVKQAQITIGSGGLSGRGIGRGSQSQLRFLPEPHTDFIFAGISESFGFIGGFVLMALYCYFLVRLSDIAVIARDNFGELIVYGVMAMFLFQVMVSVAMNLGLFPVAGIPLPFLSYGGTSILVSFFAVGLVESVFIRHKKMTF